MSQDGSSPSGSSIVSGAPDLQTRIDTHHVLAGPSCMAARTERSQAMSKKEKAERKRRKKERKKKERAMSAAHIAADDHSLAATTGAASGMIATTIEPTVFCDAALPDKESAAISANIRPVPTGPRAQQDKAVASSSRMPNADRRAAQPSKRRFGEPWAPGPAKDWSLMPPPSSFPGHRRDLFGKRPAVSSNCSSWWRQTDKRQKSKDGRWRHRGSRESSRSSSHTLDHQQRTVTDTWRAAGPASSAYYTSRYRGGGGGILGKSIVTESRPFDLT